MDLYISVISDDLAKIEEPVLEQLVRWIGDRTEGIALVNEAAIDGVEGVLGVTITINSTAKLKKPLNFLYSLAKEHKCDFVIGSICADSGDKEDVCYFGHEEGRPDMFEVGSYLEL